MLLKKEFQLLKRNITYDIIVNKINVIQGETYENTDKRDTREPKHEPNGAC